MANAFWPTAVVGEAESVNSVSASACQIGGPKGVSPGQKALLHGIYFLNINSFLVQRELTHDVILVFGSGKDYQSR